MRKFTLLCTAFCMLFLLCACHNTDYEDFYGGRPVDSDAIRSAAELLDAETQKRTDAVVTDASGVRLWFWTQSGEVYHCSPDCSRLQAAKSVLSGAIDEAISAGKDRPCASCCKETPITESSTERISP